MSTPRAILLAGLLAGLSGTPAAAQTLPIPPLAPTTAPTTAGLTGLTPRERRADAVWVLRAGLNVAALQCQFSPFLATVPTYNAMLRQHSDELADAFKTMTGYFQRTIKGRPGQRAFDTYATRTNQRWSTFDAQVGFCNAAAMVGRRALAVPKGGFGDFAQAELATFQTSTTGNSNLTLLYPRFDWPLIPTITDPCAGKTRCR